MFAPLAALLLAASPASPSAADSAASAAADSLGQRRVVRQFAPIEVVGGRSNDPRSIETVHPIPGASIRQLAVDRFVDAVGLQAGVVASGEDLHVRGGRAGELVVSIGGVPLNEGRRGSAMEVPLFAVRTAELLSGGLDADHTGSLAGELDVQTEVPTRAPTGLLRWTSDGRQGTGFDAVHARASAAIPGTAFGLVAAGEARLDDLGLPSQRSQGRTAFLGGSFGWRQDNHLLGWAKLAPLERPQRASVEVLASRVVRQPYDPMFSFDGWVSFEPDGPTGPDGQPSGRPLATSDRQLDPSYFRYRAADHAVMSEERRIAAIATVAGGRAPGARRLTLGWLEASSLTSVGLRHDTGYTVGTNRPVFGPYDYQWADPFHAYFGDESYFRDASTWRWLTRVDAANLIARQHRLRYGAGFSYEWSRLYEVDNAAPWVQRVDTLRTYQAWAPAGFAYVQHRWEFAGLTWNAGLRVQSFTAGPQARDAQTIWSWSPRMGFAYPVSDRDAFSLAYSRVFQDPPRDLLYDSRRLIYDRHPLGNGALRPSEVISYQAAIKHILDPRWSLQLGVFYRDVYGEPGTRLYETQPFVFELRYESIDDAHASGVELSLVRELPGRQRLEITYTFMNAWGAQSNLEGLAYGAALGPRPVPTGEHPLDWDERHSLALSAELHTRRQWHLSWSTRLATGLPWTPLEHPPGSPNTWPPAYEDQSLINSRRLPMNENTNLALRFTPRAMRGARVMAMVTNLFDNRTDRLATLSGFPNPIINTLYDEYGAYRTETGHGGGAYWNDADGDGQREWVPVGDRRLAAAPRTLRFGVEVGL